VGGELRQRVSLDLLVLQMDYFLDEAAEA